MDGVGHLNARFVCFLITGLYYGGAENQLICLAIRLKARGWNVQVVSMTPPKAYLQELENARIPVSSLNIRGKYPDPRPIFRLARLIWTCRPQIVHGFMVHANLLARLMRLISPIPVLICSARSTDEGGHFREHLYHRTDFLCDLTTQVSRAGLERYVEVGAVPRKKICFIPNGVDTARFCPDSIARNLLRKAMGLSAAFVWLAVGRFDVPKDYPNMLRAFAYVAKERPDAVLILVGDGLLRPTMERLAKNLSLTDRVRFLGIRRDISEVMNAADSYIMSSAWEGMANVLLEASATGLPIVATDVGGNPEVVMDNVMGLLVPPKDSESLASAMLHLMSLSDEERRKMGEAGRQHTKANYSLDRVADMWETLYSEHLDKLN